MDSDLTERLLNLRDAKIQGCLSNVRILLASIELDPLLTDAWVAYVAKCVDREFAAIGPLLDVPERPSGSDLYAFGGSLS